MNNYLSRSFVDALSLGIIVIRKGDPAAIITWNRSFCRLFDIDEQTTHLPFDLTGFIERIKPVLAETGYLTLKSDFDKITKNPGEDTITNQIALEKKANQQIVRYEICPYQEQDTDEISWVGSFQDVSAAVNREIALVRERDNFHNLLEGIQEIVYAIDSNGNLFYVNPAVTHLLGYPVDELIGQPVFKLIHPDEKKLITFMQQRKCLNKEITSEDCVTTLDAVKFITKNGEIRYFRIKEIIGRNNDPKVMVFGIAMDITKSRQLSQELEQNSQKLELLVNERTEKLHYANRQLAALNQIANEFSQVNSESELLDVVPDRLGKALDFDRVILYWLGKNGLPFVRSCYWIQDEEKLKKFEQHFKQYIAKIEQGFLEIPAVITEFFKNGKTICVDNMKQQFEWLNEIMGDEEIKTVIFAPILIHKQVMGWLGANLQHHNRLIDQQDIEKIDTFATLVGITIENIRHHAELEKLVDERTKQLKQTQSHLIQAEKMAALGNLVSGIAHEINNPVGAINSTSDVSKRCILKIKDVLQTSQSISEIKSNQKFQKAIDILTENLMISTTASERVVELVRGLKNFARLDEAEFQRANIHTGLDNTLLLVQHELKNKAEVVKDYGQIPDIYCYPNQLNQVFMNMLINSAQAIQTSGKIVLKTWFENKKVFIRISDTGCGIPEQHLDKIFDPGFTTKGAGIGTGLGLSICYNIINKHKGEIQVISKVNEGTTFTISIPEHPGHV